MISITLRIQDPNLLSGSDLDDTDLHLNFTTGVPRAKDKSITNWDDADYLTDPGSGLFAFCGNREYI